MKSFSYFLLNEIRAGPPDTWLDKGLLRTTIVFGDPDTDTFKMVQNSMKKLEPHFRHKLPKTPEGGNSSYDHNNHEHREIAANWFHDRVHRYRIPWHSLSFHDTVKELDYNESEWGDEE